MYRETSAEDRTILVTAFSGKIFGMDRASGRIVWSAAIDDSYGGEVEIAVEAGVVVACTGERLALFEYKTGRALAYVALVGGHRRRPTMIVDQGQILIARNGEVACYAMNGQALWLQPFQGMGFGSVALGLPGNVRQADDAGAK